MTGKIDINKLMLDTINKYAEALRRIEKELPPEYWDWELHGVEESKAFMNINHHLREALYNEGNVSVLDNQTMIKELSMEQH